MPGGCSLATASASARKRETSAQAVPSPLCLIPVTFPEARPFAVPTITGPSARAAALYLRGPDRVWNPYRDSPGRGRHVHVPRGLRRQASLVGLRRLAAR